MRRFVYSPAVSAYISTEFGFIDVSDDIISGEVTRRINALSSAKLVLQNPNRKYLKKIKPMDRIVIYLKRIHQPVLVFSGYIDRSPYDQLYPAPVTLTASCTLKRLLHTYWDPGLPFVTKWLGSYGWEYDTGTGTMIDPARNLYNLDYSGGLGHLLRVVMNDVGGWPIGPPTTKTPSTVHVMALPKTFIDRTKGLLKNETLVAERNQEMVDRILRNLLTADGVAINSPSSTTDNLTLTDNTRDTDPLPITVAKSKWNATIFGERLFVRDNPTDETGIVLKIASAFEAKGIPGKVGVATAMIESNLNSNAANKYGYMGLFQTQANGAGGSVNKGAHKSILEEAKASITPNSSGGYKFDESIYPSGMQISDAADWFAVALASNPINFNTATNIEIGSWVRLKAQGAVGSGNDGYELKIASTLATAQAKIVNAPNNINANTSKAQGQIGDVKTSNLKFFKSLLARRGENTSIGCTFKIKGNPYGDNDLIFRAIYDPDIPASSISIYVPGATGRGTPWAQQWKNKVVSLETSFGGNPFPGQSTKTTTSSSNTPIGNIASQGGFQLPMNQTSTHQTLGLDGFPAVDYFNKPGTKVGAPENGRLTRLSGHDPSLPPSQGQGGPWGLSFYYVGESGHLYFGTHLQETSKVGVYRKGDILGVIGDYPGSSADHIHWGIDVAPDDTARGIANAPSTITGSSAGDAYAATGVQANQQNLGAVAASAAFGVQLGFPAIASVIESEQLTGARALANDVPLFQWIEFICKASGRNFQSLPNGDFLAFYPDHFNWSGTPPYFRISPIETIDLNIDIGDEELTTHVFTTGDTYIDNEVNFFDKLSSSVASIEQADFRELVNVGPNFKPYDFLRRYGARPWQEDRPEIKHSLLQFMYGWMTFLDKWAKQFYCQAEFAFLPELFPGGIVDFPPPHDLKMYVEEVTHTFDRSSGFTTTAQLTSPATSGGHNPAMVLTDGGLSNNPPRK